MALVESIISAFLSHQFAKERQEQASQQQERMQKMQQQESMKRALMMREVIGQQQEQRLQEQIAQRKDEMEVRHQDRQSNLEWRKIQGEQVLKWREGQDKRALDRYKIEKDYSIKQQGIEYDRRLKEGIAAKEELPVKEPGRYLNLQTGSRGKPDLTTKLSQGGEWLKMDTEQEKAWIALTNMRAHVAITRQHLQTLAQKGIRPTLAISSWKDVLKNDPNAVTLFKQLESLTPLAIGRSMIGATGRAGPALATMMQGASVTPGDNLVTAIQKLDNLDNFIVRGAKANSLPTAPLFRAPAPGRSDLGAAMSVAKGDTMRAKQLLHNWGFDVSLDVRDD